MSQLTLGMGFAFEQLYDRDGLAALDARFVSGLAEHETELHNRLVSARANPDGLEKKDESQLLIDLGPHVEDFIAKLFGIESEVRALAAEHQMLAPLYACKRLFVQRRAAKAVSVDEAKAMDGNALAAELVEIFHNEPLIPDSLREKGALLLSVKTTPGDFELEFARYVMHWLDKPEYEEKLALAARYAAWALYSEEGRHRHHHGVLFKIPRKLDLAHLIPLETEVRDGVTMLRLPRSHLRHREGFALTDDGGTLAKALDEANYCIFCHNQGKDSCSKGMKEKDGSFKKSAFDITLNGCPLEEKISEMHTLKAAGVSVGALAMITVDNPMAAGTGHRICNDCMKSCIYQKQEPVNIPQAETRTLRDVLALPYGFEIYSLLTRWNPLNLRRPIPKPDTGYKILVAGLGPAGYTLAHHLMNDGHTVVGIDGLKIEPLPEEISGVTPQGKPVPFKPIRDIAELQESLDERLLAGFGGVAEYGITVRWDKNFLKIIRLLLERRRSFSMIGGVRFGSTLTYETAFALGFDHIALCMGAGKPTTLDIPNGMARGVRTASDFLMALQLTGAAKADSIANLQLRLPVVVIGGGLTAVDTATESLAYYPVQVEKFLSRYEALVAAEGVAAVRANWSAEETEIAEEFLAHAKAIRAEREQAAKERRTPRISELLEEWGGVRLVYRKRLIDAPSYRLNHEEVEKAFEEDIYFAENWEPSAIDVDAHGSARAIHLRQTGVVETHAPEAELPARTILIAAGTSPNTVLQREDGEHFKLDGKYFRAVDENGHHVTPERVAKPKDVQVLMSVDKEGRAASFFGDLHPSFAGNVVKAMGSAKQGYPAVSAILQKRKPTASAYFIADINSQLRATVKQVNRLTPTIIEVVIHAPLAAEQFQPGQFYRLQNYEMFAKRVRDTTLAMEGLAMTGAWVDRGQGLISVIALEMGGSSDLCAHLQPGEPVVLMGPTGTPTETPSGETVLLVGGGLGNAVLFSIGKALRDSGSKVLYFAGYKKAEDRYKVEEIEQAADLVVWCCDESLAYKPGRPQDRTFHGNIVAAMVAYAEGKLGNGDSGEGKLPNPQPPISLSSVNRIIAIGSDRMMAAVAKARHTALKPWLNPGHEAIGSINSPMQCMMKEICAQCLQKHVDPETGKETLIYSCFNQDQKLDHVDFNHLQQRLRQNSIQEKLTARWVNHCLTTLGLRQNAA